MKKATLILTGLLINLTVFAQQTWTRMDTNHPGHTVMDFSFLQDFAWYHLDGSNAAIKGIYKSTDDGQNWTRYPLPASPGGPFDVFKHIHYFNSDEAIITYYDMNTQRNEFYHTADGGASQVFLSDTIFTDYINSGLVAPSPCETFGLTMVDENFGYCYTFATHVPTDELTYLITVTNDGGTTWKDISMVYNGVGGAMRQIQFIDNQTGFLSIDLNPGSEVVLKTEDGGDTWDPIYTGSYPKPLVHFIDANEGYVSQESPTGFSELLKTEDGGDTWSTVFDNTLDFHVVHYDYMAPIKYSTEIKFSDNNNGVFSARANSGYIIARTSDAGLTWDVDSISTTNGELSITQMQLFGNSGSRGIHSGGLYGEGSSTFESVGIVEVESNSNNLKLFPNPNNGQFSIESQNETIGKIYDCTGRLIETVSLSEGINQINLGDNQGVYYLHSDQAIIKFILVK